MACIAHLAPEEFRAGGVVGLYKPRQVIFHQGAPATGLQLLCHGTVKLYQSDRLGRDYIVDISAAGAVLGEVGVNGTDTYSVSAEAMTHSQVCHLPGERLVAFIEKHPRSGVDLISSLSKALAAARHRAGALALKRADARLAEFLLRLAGGVPPIDGQLRVELPYSRREVAEMIGVSTETVIRLLSTLRRQRVIAIAEGSVVIVDRERLTAVAHRGARAA